MRACKFQKSAIAGEARLLRGACHRAGQRPDPLARNDVDVSLDAVIARSAQRDEAISATRVGFDGRTGNAPFWRNEPRDIKK
jgi:hypothetical protein